MKLLKTLVIVLLITTFVTPAAAATEITSAPVTNLAAVSYDVTDGCTLLTKTLAKGDSDDEVLALGNFLKDEKYFKGTPSRNFNATLEAALQDYQYDPKFTSNK